MMRVRRLCSVPRLHAAYNAALASGRLRPDASQQRAVNVIAQLESSPPGPEGVYLCGEVGSGKSMVMDLMYESSSLEPRARHHFHEFMLQVHARLHAVQEARPRTIVLTESGLPVYKFGAAPEPSSAALVPVDEPLGSQGPSLAGEEVQEAGPQKVPAPPPDPLGMVLDELTRGGQLRLLCLDELQVTDVVDAVLLRRLFEGLFARGVRVAFTSNRTPERLYERDGMARSGLAFSSPCGHPLPEKPIRPLGAALWARMEGPRRLGAEERPPWRSGACGGKGGQRPEASGGKSARQRAGSFGPQSRTSLPLTSLPLTAQARPQPRVLPPLCGAFARAPPLVTVEDNAPTLYDDRAPVARPAFPRA